MSNPVLTLAFNTFSSIVGAGVADLLKLVTDNENVLAIQQLTTQYLQDVHAILF